MGLKKSSGQIIISGSVTESALNTFTESEFDLTLDILNNEVFVVERVDLRNSTPDQQGGVNSTTDCMISKTSQTGMLSIGSDSVISADGVTIQDTGVTATLRMMEPSEQIAGTQQYLNILATNNFFVSVEGGNCIAVKTAQFKLWGYRAKADSATYAALVQSELLSS